MPYFHKIIILRNYIKQHILIYISLYYTISFNLSILLLKKNFI
nr:MAG TPA: hypothetical protein [Inoviridae sp.]